MFDVSFPRKSALKSCQVDFSLVNYRLYWSEELAGAYPTGENMSKTYNKVFSFDAFSWENKIITMILESPCGPNQKIGVFYHN